eukprot:2459125-Amphidinium_carterae.1
MPVEGLLAQIEVLPAKSPFHVSQGEHCASTLTCERLMRNLSLRTLIHRRRKRRSARRRTRSTRPVIENVKGLDETREHSSDEPVTSHVRSCFGTILSTKSFAHRHIN